MAQGTHSQGSLPRSPLWDVLCASFLFVSASILSGRVFRYTFDDEVFTLSAIESQSLPELLRTFLLEGKDIHPVFSYAVFDSLQTLGLSANELRIFSLVCTTLALATWHWLTVRTGPLDASSRLFAILLFGTLPLFVNKGDALRWYPLFAVLVAAAAWFYSRRPHSWGLLALSLGLAVATDYTGAIVVCAFLIHRYVVRREWRLSFDAPLLGTLFLLSIPSMVSLFNVVTNTAYFTSHIHSFRLVSYTRLGLGYFGGHRLGITQFWVVVPAIAATAWLAYWGYRESRRLQERHRLAGLSLILLGGMAIFAVAFGIPNPYVFFCTVPIVAMLMSWGFDTLSWNGHGRPIALVAVLACSISSIANSKSNDRPYRRSEAVPYESIADFIETNSVGSSVLLTTDANLAYALDGRPKGLCIDYIDEEEMTCLDRNVAETFIFVDGRTTIKEAAERKNIDWREVLEKGRENRSLVATGNFGIDKDAEIKTAISGRELSRSLLTVYVYRQGASGGLAPDRLSRNQPARKNELH